MKVGTVLADTIEFWVDLETSLGAASRLALFIQNTPVEESQEGQETIETVPHNWPNSGCVEFANVSSDYTTISGRSRALRNATVTIAGDTKVGIVGRTGCGKSSLFMTLLNLLSHTGQVKIDGYEISTTTRTILGSRITTIAQDLLNRPLSVRDNITPWDMDKPPSERTNDAVIVAALHRVGLHDQILERGGLDARIEDVGLSYG